MTPEEILKIKNEAVDLMNKFSAIVNEYVDEKVTVADVEFDIPADALNTIKANAQAIGNALVVKLRELPGIN